MDEINSKNKGNINNIEYIILRNKKKNKKYFSRKTKFVFEQKKSFH